MNNDQYIDEISAVTQTDIGGGHGKVIDPNMDPEEAIKLIRLPPETIYTIDKVIRLKSKMGPIGIGNSEVINIEMETEFKKKHQHLMNLAEGKR